MTINGNIIELQPSDIKVIDASIETKPVEDTVTTEDEVLVTDDNEESAEPTKTESKDVKHKKHKVINATPIMLRAELKYQHELKPHVDKFKAGTKQEFNERVDDVKEIKKEIERTIDYAPKRTKRFFRDVATNMRMLRF